MPKMKSNSGAKKRFKLLPSGKVKRAQQMKNHILNKKSRKRKRNLRQGAYVFEGEAESVRKMLQKN